MFNVKRFSILFLAIQCVFCRPEMKDDDANVNQIYNSVSQKDSIFFDENRDFDLSNSGLSKTESATSQPAVLPTIASMVEAVTTTLITSTDFIMATLKI